ncbi:hypothetical protein O181_052722 [Austropuccinia psidii MF-1]|uniref:Uncharacterized protein n=1 Tax=Austropuccinia psidii MF-1 TaxID=1389203 RepID=A0A9Q3E3H0_9BASI|nr:hypothetical protein [Austropuccinia psidii MF-1]
MILLTAEWRKNNPPPPKQVPRTAPVASRSNSNMKKQPQAQNKGKGKASATESQRLRRMPWKMYFRWPEQWWNYRKRRNPTKISEMISDILDSIPNLYIAINDMKSQISDKNLSICNNLKTNNLSLSQTNETLMCFEKVLRIIKTSKNENSFGNKLNEQYSIIKELTDNYSKFNIDGIIETRLKQAINIIKE